MIQITNLTKQFGDFTAVDNLSFDIKPGDIVGFLGPNGAGKSTTMKMITGFLEPSAGEIKVNGFNIDSHALDAKKTIGYLPEGAPAYGDMTPAQFLSFIADVRGLTGSEKTQRIKDVIASVELESVLDRPIDNLSKGFKRRVGLAQAIIHDPKVLILDEPTDGLDPNQKHQVRKLIENLSKDKLVIISTHILEEVTAVCNRAVIIAGGKKLFDGTPLELEAQSKYHQSITLKFTEGKPDTSVLNALSEVKEVLESEDDNAVTLIPQNDAESLFAVLFAKSQSESWPVAAMFAERGRLDDVFRSLTAQV
ncbi:ABC transporter ATP-binding protein [Catenovulum sp. SM1970]|uniref:ABC transporter ATP-binding protein n=1 Tax=Marinifaba aquimaris TaxID=2741323 RepID=UPI0015744AB1|nr:ABC transporter ATP-binding protein [Marinifaba aquimaris]NTS77612.1 ABC transporter ATP-binding protein [Marinifaba aquimaris]